MTATTEKLEKIGRRIRILMIIRSVASLVAMSILAAILLVVLDYLFMLPGILRLVLLSTGIALLVIGFLRMVVPAIRFKPGNVQIALRTERLVPELRGKIASASEFSSSGLSVMNPMADNLIDEVDTHLSSVPDSSIIRIRPTILSSLALLSSILLAMVFVLASSDLSLIGIRRLFTPLGSARWPATTFLVPTIVDGGVYPRGVPLTVSALLEKGGSDTRVSVDYSIIDGGSVVERNRILLTPQGGGIYERLLEVDGDAMQFSFKTRDFTAEPLTIRIVDPPEILETRLEVDPPEYAREHLQPIILDLGPGTDVRGYPESPILKGSRVRFDFTLSKDLPVPGTIDEAWLNDTFGDFGPGAEFNSENPSSWVLERELNETTSSVFTLVDEHGIVNVDEVGFGLTAVDDRMPSTVIIDPRTDELVLPGAMIPIRAEGRDDVAIDMARIQVARTRSGSDVISTGEVVESLDFKGGIDSIEMDHVIHLGDLGASSGDVFVITSQVSDGYRIGDITHPVVTSNPRTLTVISSDEFTDLVQQQIASIRRNTIQIDALQEEVRERSDMDPESAATDQARITQRISNTDEALASIEEDLSRNNLDDPILDELMSQSRDILTAAGRASSRASEQLEESMNQSRPDGSNEGAEDRSELDEFQQEVRDELMDLVALLDRNEDSWLVTRQVEEVLDELLELRDRTNDLGSETIGRTRSELDEEQRNQLDQLSDRQAETARKSEELSDSLRERGRIMDQTDQQRAESLQSAARRAERSELSRDLQEASEQIRENQISNARESQEESIETLQGMLEDLQEDRRARAEQLARLLSSLVKSIEQLVAGNEDELISIARIPDPDAPGFGDALDRRISSQIALAGNTASVRVEATSSGPGAQRIARRIESAEVHQGDSIRSLRTDSIDVDVSEFKMNQSLEELMVALELAREAEQAAREEESRQKRDELRTAYTQLAERESGIRFETEEIAPPPGEAAGRRTRVRARRLSLDQESIRTDLQELIDSNPGIESTLLFIRVHEMIDDWSSQVRDRLHSGDTGEWVRDREDLIIESLLDLAEVLDETSQDESPFSENQPAGGDASGSSGQQQQQQQQQSIIPPISELKLLRNLQEQIYRRTRSIDESLNADDRTEADVESTIRELAEMQSELFDLGTRLLESMKQDAPNPTEAPPPGTGGGT